MRFEGTQTIAAPIESVWAFLMDPHRVGPCLPGFQSVEVIDAQHFKARVGIGIAAVKATFNMDMTMADLQPPAHATIKGHGVAPISAVDLTSTMDLSDAGDGTTALRWTADVVVSGTLAGLGARLMNATAQKMTGQLFTCIKEKLEAPGA